MTTEESTLADVKFSAMDKMLELFALLEAPERRWLLSRLDSDHLKMTKAENLATGGAGRDARSGEGTPRTPK